MKPILSFLDTLCACPLLSEYSREEIETARLSLASQATRSHTLEEWAGACRDLIEGKFSAEETPDEKRGREHEEFVAVGLELARQQIRRNQADDRREQYFQYLYISRISLCNIRLMYEHPFTDYDAIRANKIQMWR
jgi:hypothetical protein